MTGTARFAIARGSTSAIFDPRESVSDPHRTRRSRSLFRVVFLLVLARPLNSLFVHDRSIIVGIALQIEGENTKRYMPNW
jgi:hypothetical protein